MKFCHPNGVRLALLSGHVAIVGPEWTTLEPMFHQEALEKGCHCDQTVINKRTEHTPDTSKDAMQTLDPPVAIRKAIVQMLERNEEGDFTAADNPNLNIVASLVGFKPSKEDMLKVWHALQAESAAAKKAAEDVAAGFEAQ